MDLASPLAAIWTGPNYIGRSNSNEWRELEPLTKEMSTESAGLTREPGTVDVGLGPFVWICARGSGDKKKPYLPVINYKQ
jgi:hypothetical protein